MKQNFDCIFESILDDLKKDDGQVSSVKQIVQMSDNQNQKMSYQQWYNDVSNSDYEQMFCISHHFMGEDYVHDIEEFREDLEMLLTRFFGTHWSMQIVASNDKYEDIGIQKEPGLRSGGLLLNEIDMTNDQVRFKFAVEFRESARRKVITYLDFISTVYNLIRRPTSGARTLSNTIKDSGRLEIYPFVNEEVKYMWPSQDNTDCIISSSAYQYRFLKDHSSSTETEVLNYDFQMYSIDLTRELPEPFDVRDYREVCRWWLNNRKRK